MSSRAPRDDLVSALTTKEAAVYLGMHERTVRDLAEQERAFPGTGIVASNIANNSTPQGRRLRFQKRYLDRFLEARQHAA